MEPSQPSEAIACSLFVRFAGDDLDRWREIVGQTVVHRDPRWGCGLVRDARWSSPLPHVAPYTQLAIRYEEGTEVRIRATGLAVSHEKVTVSSALASLIVTCYAEGAEDSEPCRSLLLQYDRALRERRTSERLHRIAEMTRRSRGKTLSS